MNSALAVANINFRTSKLAYMIFLIMLPCIIVSSAINIAVESVDNNQVSPGSYAFLLVILFAVFIPALHFRKFMNLNVKKTSYIKGCAVNYVIMALIASAINMLFYITVDKLMTVPPSVYMWNLLDIFGWSQNGLVIAFVQQFAFLLLLSVVVHVLTTIQTFWYGWVIDLIIAAIISVFTPIASLRGLLIGFFDLIIFTPNALLQIATCFILSIVIYALGIVPVKHKPV